jgi:hypothetical protein
VAVSLSYRLQFTHIGTGPITSAFLSAAYDDAAPPADEALPGPENAENGHGPAAGRPRPLTPGMYPDDELHDLSVAGGLKPRDQCLLRLTLKSWRPAPASRS